MKFEIEINIKEVLHDPKSKIIVVITKQARAMSEVLRHTYHVDKMVMVVWGNGVTIYDFNKNDDERILREAFPTFTPRIIDFEKWADPN